MPSVKCSQCLRQVEFDETYELDDEFCMGNLMYLCKECFEKGCFESDVLKEKTKGNENKGQ